MKNLGQLMKQAQQMQAKMAEVQEQLAQTTAEGQSGGGLVRVTITGKQEITRVKLDPGLVDPREVEVLEDLIVAAANDARIKIQAEIERQMQSVAGGLSLPPGMKLPF
jgi:DNA-binding YbaB/EbfC family protein